MHRSRITPDRMEPAFFNLLLQLNLLVCINQRAYQRWRSQHQTALMEEFQRRGLEAETYFDVWAREQFLAGMVPA